MAKWLKAQVFEEVRTLELEERLREDTDEPLEGEEWCDRLTTIQKQSYYRDIHVLWVAYCNEYNLHTGTGDPK